MVSCRAVSLTFVVGSASDVFSPQLAAAVDWELKKRYPAIASSNATDAYRSDAVDGRGWGELQRGVPALANIDAYQAAFIPALVPGVVEIALPNVADPLHLASLGMLVQALEHFAAARSLPTDEVQLLQLAAHYLESDELIDTDLDIQTYVQLMLSAKQATTRRQAVWIVV